MFLKQTILGLSILALATAGTQDPGSRQQPQGWLQGQLLVASSGIRDPRFNHAVILMVDHGENGAMGLIVNIPAAYSSLAELLGEASLPPPRLNRKVRVNYGGPVQLDFVFLLHSTDVQLASSRLVVAGVALSTDPEMLRLIGEGKGPRDFLLLRGYAGWRPGQLEAEIDRGSWIPVKATASNIFAKDPDQTWKQLMKGHRL